METTIQNKTFGIVKSMIGKIKPSVVETMKTAKKVGEDDPRRIVHAMKVGLALTLVSLFYYFRPLYDGFGQAGMWAILTVVVVFEYTVGGTLSKSLNRGFATLVAGALGIGAEYLADLCGKKGEPVLLGLLVFLLAAASTFTRFFPNVKRRYDYGVLIFILTFTMVAVSGFRVTEILQLAHQRLSTIVIGGATCMMTSIFIYPVWAGQDLHNLVAGNIEKLVAFLEGFGGELVLMFPGDEISKASTKNEDKSFLQSYKSVINSKANEESLANFAWWEPPHGRFKFRHPWKQYLKIGAVVRECACLIEALNGYTNKKSHERVTSELQMKLQQACIKMSTESGKALRELAIAIKKMTFPSNAAKAHAQSCKAATDDLKTILENSPSLYTKANLHEIMPLLVIASVLIDITSFVEKISLSVHELSQKARFKNAIKPKGVLEKQHQVLHRGIVKPFDDDCVVVEVNDGGGLPKKKDYSPPE
ncbi:aluminum-activated malate transporter 8 [Phtheirospermum japonicum]|uniref:Aluminum-activated malate transporter 8 n=1 Tax=Phtheirospermum japonicum TaxID=374723 RepID=A0A830B6Q3_9LAMI|nr:aluminum-activated malate transporter 8 [Phtheirospermum japonicum]